MKKSGRLDSGYIFWKTVIHFLVSVMTLVGAVPLFFLLRDNGLEKDLPALISSGAGYLLFLLFSYWLMQKSDLSGISKREYILGECVASGILALLGNLVLLLLSKGLSPTDYSPVALAFLPECFFSYLTGNILLGILLQILIGFPAFLLLYALKKKKDPTLKGNKKQTSECNDASNGENESDNEND